MTRPVVPRPEQPVTGPERVVVDSGSADPFSRFSLLEAQLRQMSLDESITDDELERHRRHAAPGAEPAAAPAAALSFTPPEVAASTPDGPTEALGEAQAAVESPSEEPAPTPRSVSPHLSPKTTFPRWTRRLSARVASRRPP